MRFNSCRREAIGMLHLLGYDNLKILGSWGNMKNRNIFFSVLVAGTFQST